MPSSYTQPFEDAAFAVAQALSPNRKVRREDMNFDVIRRVIGDICDRRGVLAERGATPSVEDDCGVSSSSDSRPSFDDFSLSMTAAFTASATTSATQSAAPPPPQKRSIRQMQEMRVARRKAATIDRLHEFECDVDDLPAEFAVFFSALLAEEPLSQIKRFHVVINSLTHYFSRVQETKHNNLQKAMADFLRAHVILSNRDLAKKYEEAASRDDCPASLIRARLMETEAIILLELYALVHFPAPVSQTTLVEKLGFIYTEDSATRMRTFLEDDICDNFAHVVPKLVYALFDELDVMLPLDLEPLLAEAETTVDEKMEVDDSLLEEEKEVVAEEEQEVLAVRERVRLAPARTPSPPPTPQKTDLSARIASLLMESEESEPPSSSAASGHRVNHSQKTAPEQRRSLRQARRAFVPETPDDKEKNREEKKQKSGSKNGKPAVVLQTPMAKLLRARRSGRGDKIAALVKSATGSAAASPAASLASPSSPPSSGLRRSSRPRPQARLSAAARDSPLTTRSAFLPAADDSTSSSPRSRAKTNLAKRFNTGSPMAPPAKRALIAPASAPSSPDKKATKNGTSAVSSIASLVLDAEAMKRYKERMKEVQIESRKEDPSTVFYGRMSNRVGLFDGEREKVEVAKLSFSRAGRLLYNPSCVFVAHTLLNVHNPAPLLPTRPSSSGAEFKLGRLVKAASKGDRRKLNRLRVRFEKVKAALATKEATATPPSSSTGSDGCSSASLSPSQM